MNFAPIFTITSAWPMRSPWDWWPFGGRPFCLNWQVRFYRDPDRWPRQGVACWVC